jgi:hypothetical protein
MKTAGLREHRGMSCKGAAVGIAIARQNNA